MLEQDWHRYCRQNGIEMDLPQFIEIFGARAAGDSVRIPRGLDRLFQSSADAAHDPVKALVQRYRADTKTKLERKIFAQRKRLADAERTLLTKQTRKALEERRIASSKVSLAMARLPLLSGNEPDEADWRIFPMGYAPVIVDHGGRRLVRLARYHCRPASKPAAIDRQFPGLYNARRDNLEKFWGEHFGRHHAILLVESFYENVQRDGANVVLHFQPRPVATMFIACLYSEWVDPDDGTRLSSFAAITDEPPTEVAAAGHDRMIVNLRPENVDAWLSPAGRTRRQLQALLDDRQAPYYEHEVLAA